MKSAQKVGVGLIIFGLLFLVINFIMLKTSGYFLPKLLLVGIVITISSIGFIVRPGANVHLENNNRFFQDLWSRSKGLDRIVWVVFLLLSLLACWFIFNRFGLPLL
ncbi:MAG: hypothetical protein ACPG4Z_08820 [Chitinophagales bacterium]